MSEWNEDMEQYREDAKDLRSKSVQLKEPLKDGDSLRVHWELDAETLEPLSIEIEAIPKEKLDAIDKLTELSIERNIFIYDKRELRSGRPQQVEAALSAWGMECKIVPVILPIGDYIINGCCIEYKTAEDFIQSKISGHLDRQLFSMSTQYPNSYLVVEGDVELQAEGRVHENAILSSLIGASFRRSSSGFHGMVNLIRISSASVFPNLVKFMMKKKHIRYPPPLKVPVSKKEMAVATLSTFPSVSTIRARALIEHFKTLKAVFSATKDELKLVSGVGEDTAAKILKHLSTKVERHIL